MIAASFAVAFFKDLRLLARDRVGLVFLTLAPIIVITVAGFSLASLYGADPSGATAYLLPVVDEDGGAVGQAIRERLAREPTVTVQTLPSRAEAMARLESREAGAVLVIPAGTSAAQESGNPSRLLLLTDPVKYLEIANIRALVEELRHGIETEARRRVAERLAEAAQAAEHVRAELVRAGQQAKDRVAALRERLARAREETAAAIHTAKERSEKAAREAAQRTAERRRAEAATRLEAALAPVKQFLRDLTQRQQEFAQWLGAVRERAGKLADRMPQPPPPPELPAALRELVDASPQQLVDRMLGNGTAEIELPPLPDVNLPPVPSLAELQAIDVPHLETPQAATLPGSIDIEEQSATGAPRRLNTFDQNVPGFSVTFLLLGMLLGVSLSLLDERDWGTLERLRAMPAPFSSVLLAKLASRLTVGVIQMVLLFAVGRVAFGISLGPEPWALLLPTAGIVFAGTAFGLVVAGLARSREAVLPIGSIVIVTMAAVGGCWWPIDLEPRWMRSVALGFPTTWAMSAYNDLMIRRQSATAALQPAAVLLAYGLAYLALGLALFRRQR